MFALFSGLANLFIYSGRKHSCFLSFHLAASLRAEPPLKSSPFVKEHHFANIANDFRFYRWQTKHHNTHHPFHPCLSMPEAFCASSIVIETGWAWVTTSSYSSVFPCLKFTLMKETRIVVHINITHVIVHTVELSMRIDGYWTAYICSIMCMKKTDISIKCVCKLMVQIINLTTMSHTYHKSSFLKGHTDVVFHLVATNFSSSCKLSWFS